MALRIGDAAGSDEPSATNQIPFRIAREGDPALSVAVGYATTSGTATPDVDYIPQTGEALIPAGAVGVDVAILLSPDEIADANETFGLNLTGVVNVSGGNTAWIIDSEISLAARPTVMAEVDVDLNGLTDLVVADSTAQKISIYLRTFSAAEGRHAFSGPIDIPISGSVATIASADFNRDGWNDLAIGFDDRESALIAINQSSAGGEPVFSTSLLTLPAVLEKLTVADLNRDGRTDLVAAGVGSSIVHVFVNSTIAGQETPAFFSGVELSVGSASTATPAVVADFNNDGRLDLAAGNDEPTVSVWLNTTVVGASQPQFGAPLRIGVSHAVNALQAGDFNRDGRLDLVAAGSDTIGLLAGTTSPGAAVASFAEAQLLTVSGAAIESNGIQVAEFNGDGNVDLALFDRAGARAVALRNLTRPGSQTFDFAPPDTIVDFAKSGGAESGLIVAFDFTGDGRTDLATAADASEIAFIGNATLFPSSMPGISVDARDNQAASSSVVAADFNLDGRIDTAAVINLVNPRSEIHFRMNTSVPGGPISFTRQVFDTSELPLYMETGDINGDGRPDIVQSFQQSGGIAAWLNTTPPGAATVQFTGPTYFQAPGPAGQFTIADITRDGRPDLVVKEWSQNDLRVYINTTASGAMTPSFAPAVEFESPSSAGDVAVADMNQDGIPDIVFSSHSDHDRSLSVFLNYTAPGSTTLNLGPRQDMYGGYEPITVELADVNADGLVDVITAIRENSWGRHVAIRLNRTMPGSEFVDLAPAQTFYSDQHAYDLEIADYDHDGRDDLAFVNYADGIVSFLLNRTAIGSPIVEYSDRYSFDTGGGSLVSADFNHDGWVDVSTGNRALRSTPVSIVDAAAEGRIIDGTVPHAISDVFVVNEDTTLEVAAPGLLANDASPLPGELQADVLSQPAHGELQWNADGSFRYEPEANYFGTDSFTYRVRDGKIDSAPATVTIEVQSVNDAPIGNPDTFVVDEDTRLNVYELPPVDLEVVPAGSTWRYQVASGVVSTVWNARPATYDDSSWAVGRAELGYGDGDEATVIGYGGNAANKYITTYFRHAFVLPPRWRYISLTPIVKYDDGIVVYVNSGEVGRAGMPSGTVAWSTRAVEAAPDDGEQFHELTPATSFQLYTGSTLNTVAVEVHQAAPDSSDVSFDMRLVVRGAPPDGVLVNDSDAEGDLLYAILAAPPQHGFVRRLEETGKFEYEPDPDYFGPDSFSYRVSDGISLSDVITVSIDVRAIDDQPRAAVDRFEIDEDTQLSVDAAGGVLSNDVEVDSQPLTATIVTPPLHGTVSLLPDGSFTYTPAANYTGTDAFTYKASDGGLESGVTDVMLVIRPIADPPTAVDDSYDAIAAVPLNANTPYATDALHQFVETFDGTALPSTLELVTGTLEFVDGALTADNQQIWLRSAATDYLTGDFTIDIDFDLRNGTYADANFAFGGRSPTNGYQWPDLGLAIEINLPYEMRIRVNDPTTFQNTGFLPISGASYRLRFQRIGNRFTTEIDMGFNGAFRPDYTYAFDDVAGTPFLVPTNSRFYFGGDTAALFKEISVRYHSRTPEPRGVLANDEEDSGLPLTATVVEMPQHGTLQFDSDGTFVYVADREYIGVDEFRYVATNGNEESSVGVARINVRNSPPTAVGEFYLVPEDGSLTVSADSGVLANDSDVQFDAMTAEVLDRPRFGTLTMLANGSFRYAPLADYFGSDHFTYAARDRGGLSNEAQVSLTVSPVNDAPIARDDTYTIAAGQNLVASAAILDYRATVMAAGPLAYWRLDDAEGSAAVDIAGGNHLDYQGSVLRQTSGALGNDPNAAAYFDGESSYLVAPEDEPWNQLTTNFTLEAWIKPAHLAGAAVLLSTRGSVADKGFTLWRDGGRLVLSRWGAGEQETATDVLSAARWQHVVASFDGDGTTAIYFDGVLAAHFTDEGGPVLPANHPLHLGGDLLAAENNDVLSTWQGGLDEVAIYGKVLSPFEVKAHFLAGTASRTLQSSTLLPRGAVWSYRDNLQNVQYYPTDSQGREWFEPTYNTAGWSSGPAILGYGTIDAGAIRTTLGFGGNAENKYRTALFRRSINIADASLVRQLRFELLADDGARIYINGREVLRHNLPGTLGDAGLRPDTFALGVGNETTYTNFDIDLEQFPGLLVAGTNWIAVEVHQAAPNSSDLGFDMAILATSITAANTTVGVLANDTDAENDAFGVTIVSQPKHGVVSLSYNGAFAYTPNVGFVGIDSFSYRAQQSSIQASQPAWVTINVGGASASPTAAADYYVAIQDQPLSVSAASGVLRNDAHLNRLTMTAMLVGAPAHGQIVLLDDGAFRYSPNSGFVGNDSFLYQVESMSGAPSLQEATIFVRRAVDPIDGIPVAIDDAYSADSAATLSIAAPGVLSNDGDPELQTIVAVLEHGPRFGSIVFAADGGFSYMPLDGFTGEDTFTYRATDGNTFSTAATVVLNVAAATPAAPLAELPAVATPTSTLASPVPSTPGSTTTAGGNSTGLGSTTTLPIFADLNGDGRVDRADLAALVAAYGSANTLADLNADGQVSLADANALRNAMAAQSFASDAILQPSARQLVPSAVDQALIYATRRRVGRRPSVDAALLYNVLDIRGRAVPSLNAGAVSRDAFRQLVSNSRFR